MDENPKFNIKDIYLVFIWSIIIAFSIFLRIHFFYFKSGDYDVYLRTWYEYIINNSHILALKTNFSNYNPPYLWFLVTASYFKIRPLTAVKYISIIFDYLACIPMCLIVIEMFKSNRKNLLYIIFICLSIFLFTPTVVLNGSLWGQADMSYVLFLLFSFYFLLNKKLGWSYLFWGIAFAFKLQAVFFLPIYGFFFIAGELNWFSLPLLIAPYFISFIPSILVGNNLWNLISVYIDQASSNHQLTLNAASIYVLLPTNVNGFRYYVDGGTIITFILILTLLFVSYKLKVKMTTENILSIVLMLLILVPTFLPKMHERYIFPADVFSIIYILRFPKRFLVYISLQFVSIMTYEKYLFGGNNFPYTYLFVVQLFSLLFVTYFYLKANIIQKQF